MDSLERIRFVDEQCPTTTTMLLLLHRFFFVERELVVVAVIAVADVDTKLYV